MRGDRSNKSRMDGRQAPQSSDGSQIDSIDRSISKFMCLILRHQPHQFGLQLDNRGFVPLEDLIRAIATKREWITENDIRRIVESSEKQRFEISSSMIRARYGHSVAVSFDEDEATPPEFLYHGSSRSAVESVRNEGLKGMDRQFVHLSAAREEALSVGKRHDPGAVVLKIKALEAHVQGYTFYKTGPLYMTKVIPPQFIIFP